MITRYRIMDSSDNIEIINEIIKENLETAKKSKMPFW